MPIKRPGDKTRAVRLTTDHMQSKLAVPDARILATALTHLGGEASTELAGRIREVIRSRTARPIQVTALEEGALLLAVGVVECDGYLNADLSALRSTLLGLF